MRSGTGIATCDNGVRYEGNWENDVRSGTGQLFLSDGDTYIGNWANDVFEGRGRIVALQKGQFYSTTRSYGTQFENGIPVCTGTQEGMWSYRYLACLLHPSSETSSRWYTRFMNLGFSNDETTVSIACDGDYWTTYYAKTFNTADAYTLSDGDDSLSVWFYSDDSKSKDGSSSNKYDSMEYGKSIAYPVWMIQP